MYQNLLLVDDFITCVTGASGIIPLWLLFPPFPISDRDHPENSEKESLCSPIYKANDYSRLAKLMISA